MDAVKLLCDELLAERDLCDRLAAELNKWGWGDFHYGETPQDPQVVALVEEHKRRRDNETNGTPEGGDSSTQQREDPLR
jgi:hypothetical protein